jgi:hypothetical protein
VAAAATISGTFTLRASAVSLRDRARGNRRTACGPAPPESCPCARCTCGTRRPPPRRRTACDEFGDRAPRGGGTSRARPPSTTGTREPSTAPATLSRRRTAANTGTVACMVPGHRRTSVAARREDLALPCTAEDAALARYPVSADRIVCSVCCHATPQLRCLAIHGAHAAIQGKRASSRRSSSALSARHVAHGSTPVEWLNMRCQP